MVGHVITSFYISLANRGGPRLFCRWFFVMIFIGWVASARRPADHPGDIQRQTLRGGFVFFLWSKSASSLVFWAAFGSFSIQEWSGKDFFFSLGGVRDFNLRVCVSYRYPYIYTYLSGQKSIPPNRYYYRDHLPPLSVAKFRISVSDISAIRRVRISWGWWWR